MTEDESLKHMVSEMDKWPEDKRDQLMWDLMTFLNNRPSDPVEREEWADLYKKKMIEAFGLEKA